MPRRDLLVSWLATVCLALLATGMSLSAPARPRPTRVPPATLPPAPAPQVLRWGAPGRVFSLDPLLATTPAEQIASSLLFRGLTRLGPDGTQLPDLATGWDVTDSGATWTFHLRTDAHWHDGPLVDADDVLFTVARLRDPTSGGTAATDWSAVTVDRVDRFTVRFRIPVPLASFLPLTTAPILPAHLLGSVPFASWRSLPLQLSAVGDGRFRLAGMSDVGLRLERAGPPPGGPRSSWPPGEAIPEATPATAGEPMSRLDAIEIVFEPDVDSLRADLGSGHVDLAAGLRAVRATDLAVAGATAIRYPTTTAAVLVPNLRFSARPFADAGVRRALSAAVDRTSIVAAVLGGAGEPAQTLIPPASPLWDADASGTPSFDLEAAAAGLRAAGWTETNGAWVRPNDAASVRVELLVPDGDAELASTARRIGDGWTSLGLGVDIVALAPVDLLEHRLRPGDFDVTLLRVDVGLEADLYPLLVSAEAQVGGTNLSGYQSSTLDRLLDDARRPADPATRASRFRVLQATLREELPLIPICFADEVLVTSPRASGPASRLVRDVRDLGWDVLGWRLASGPDE